MHTYDIIKKKRDGGELSHEEIAFIIGGIATGLVPDYQASAFLMAVFLRGMTDPETVAMTEAMVRSGRTLEFGDAATPIVDKHSTGGVGDKTSIILAPLMAAMGTKVPMIAGRGLGHTGGTIDKLHAIPGFRTDLSADEFSAIVGDIGVAIAEQGPEIAPADRVLYRLRDVTATVESIPLIASSIMSKKLSEGLRGLVLDVKVGSGAFTKDLQSARSLAHTMVKIGNAMGVRTVAVITDMDQPLGRTVGNSLEIKEAISALKGKGAPDLMEVTLILAASMLSLSDAITEECPTARLTDFTTRGYKHEAMEFIEKGDALKKFLEMVDAQGGDVDAVMGRSALPGAAFTKVVPAPRDGILRALDAEAVGTAARLLGAGRMRAEDEIDLAAGIVINRKVGETVREGEPLAILHYNDGAALAEAEEAFVSGIEIGEREKPPRPAVIESIS